MTPSATKRLLPYIIAWTDGKEVIYQVHDGWRKVDSLSVFVAYSDCCFKIVEAKPEPKVIFVNELSDETKINYVIDKVHFDSWERATQVANSYPVGTFVRIAVPYREVMKDE